MLPSFPVQMLACYMVSGVDNALPIEPIYLSGLYVDGFVNEDTGLWIFLVHKLHGLGSGPQCATW